MKREGSSAEQRPSLHPNFSPANMIISSCPGYITVTLGQVSSVNKVVGYVLDNQHSIPGSTLFTSTVKMETACSYEAIKRLCGAA
jgi:hypothetical protein